MSNPAATLPSNVSTPDQNAASLRLHILVWVLFVFSGACGLIYEVLWCRQLGLLFGNTAHSLSTVLTAFMGGLALGSFVAGRMAHKIQRPFMFYGILEVCIGIYCAILPILFGEHSPLIPMYRSLYGEAGSSSLVAVRLIVSLLLLVIPTTFMGATLPLLTHFLSRTRGSLGRTVGTLYALNSFGAVLGAAATGFVLLPLLGKIDTNWLAVGINIVLGLSAIALGAKETMPVAPVKEVAAPSDAAHAESTTATKAIPLPVRLTVLTFGLTGFAAMVTQIGWTKAISLGTGSSTYAFSLIVAVFIMGLSFGGAWGARRSTQVADPLGFLSRCLVQVGVLNLIVSTLLGFGPLLFYFLIVWTSPYGWQCVLLAQGLGVALLIAAPTFLMGATMPLTMQVVQNLSPDPARTTGTVYSINTLGAILGSALGGLFLIPLFQIQASLEIMALLYAVPGFALFWLSPSRHDKKQLRQTVTMAVALVVLTQLVPPWDKMLMSSGIYLMREKARQLAAREGRILDALPKWGNDEEIIYYREGAEATVAVWKTPFDLSLRVGGKPDATAYGDLHTQVCLTMVPELIHNAGPKDVLIIGLGSGVSAGAALALESVEHVDIIEMSPEVVKASAYFSDANTLKYSKLPDGEKWIDTPRVQVIVNDGRNHLLLSSRQYDVIASEPSNPWMAGVGNLFTHEAFELTKSRLRPGGIMCQWIHTYNLNASHIMSIIKTFGDVYPNMQMWHSKVGDYLLVGSDTPIRLPFNELSKRLAQPQVRNWLQRVHYDTEEEFLATLFDQDAMLRMRSKNAELHTDNNMLLEFDAPKTLFGRYVPFIVTTNAIFEKVVDVSDLPPEQAALTRIKLDRAAAAREHYRLSLVGMGESRDHMNVAGVLAPYMYFSVEFQNAVNEAESQRLLSGGPLEQTTDSLGALKLEEEIQKRSQYMRYSPKVLQATRMRVIEDAIKNGTPTLAEQQLLVLSKEVQDPLNFGWAQLFRAQIAELKGDYKTAIEQAQLAMNNKGDARKSTQLLHRALLASGRKDDAFGMIQDVNNTLKSQGLVDPELAIIEAQTLFNNGSVDAAASLAREIEKRAPKDPRPIRLQALIFKKKGMFSDASLYCQNWYALEPQALEPKIEYAQALMREAENIVLGGKPELALDMLRIGRRLCVEAAVLHPDATEPWLTMARMCKAIEKLDPVHAKESHLQAQQAAKKLLMHLGGKKSDLPPDVTDLIDE